MIQRKKRDGAYWTVVIRWRHSENGFMSHCTLLWLFLSVFGPLVQFTDDASLQYSMKQSETEVFYCPVRGTLYSHRVKWVKSDTCDFSEIMLYIC